MGRKENYRRNRTGSQSEKGRKVTASNQNRVAERKPLAETAIRGEETPHVFYLTIPCSTGKPDRLTPLYLVETNALGGGESAIWQCRDCGSVHHTRKSWAKHVGLVVNVMGKCPVLYPPKEEDLPVQDLERDDYGDDLDSFL